LDSVLRDKKAIIIFILPVLIIYIGIIVFPMFASVYYSTLSWDGIGEKTFVGINNYIALFFNGDPFNRAIVNSFLLALSSVFVQLPIALLLALMLAKGVRFESFYRTVYFIPVMLSSVVIGHLWKRIYHPTLGLLNELLSSIGLEAWTKAWLGDMSTAMVAVFIPIIWQWIGYHMLLMYAAAKAVPNEFREAAIVDGASEFKIATKVIIPLMKPVLKVCVILAVIGSFKAFDLIYVLTRGGPVYTTEVPSTMMINTIFHSYQYGYGSAMAIFIVIECLLFTLIIQKANRNKNITY